MHPSLLGIDILLLHLAPLLSPADILSLTATDRILFVLLGHLRFERTVATTTKGFVLDYLRPSTLPSVRHITLNGSISDNQRIFTGNELRFVSTATIYTEIPRAQSHSFARLVSQLTELTEAKVDHRRGGSNLRYLPAGSLSHLKFLRLEATLPANLQSLLSVARDLTTLHILHFPDETTDGAYNRYAGTLVPLLDILSSRTTFPSLRLVQLVAGCAASAVQAKIRQTILTGIWAAIAAHGNWRLLAQKTSRPSSAFPKGWKSWWSDRDWDFFITSEELGQFRVWCAKQKRPPILASFVCGRIHVQVTSSIPGVAGVVVYGVSVFAGAESYGHASLSVVTKDTRAILITLEKDWGFTPTEMMDARFGSVQALKIESRAETAPYSRRRYTMNISAGFVRTLGVRNWHGLRSLCLPVCAFQKPLDETMKLTAACGSHIPAYDLAWLAECGSLKALDLTNWSTCYLCRLPEEVSLQGGLRHLGPRVEFLQISGHYRCPAHGIPRWREVVEEGINAGVQMGERSVVMMVRLKGLRVDFF